jgi:DNA-binding NarL/FixJ family response regulator
MEDMMSIRLVLADDHPPILQGLTLLLRQEPDLEVLAGCRDSEETLQAVRQFQPDVLILDILMPGKDGLAVLRELRQLEIPTRVILLTAAIDEDNLLEAMRLGVGGVVLKEMAVPLLIQCVRKVYAGDQWLERHSIGRAMEKMLRREAGTREVAKLLTSRELEIVRLAASGLRNKEIASKLAISEGTVKIHLHRSYEKLHVDSRIALLHYAQTKGLV